MPSSFSQGGALLIDISRDESFFLVFRQLQVWTWVTIAPSCCTSQKCLGVWGLPWFGPFLLEKLSLPSWATPAFGPPQLNPCISFSPEGLTRSFSCWFCIAFWVTSESLNVTLRSFWIWPLLPTSPSLAAPKSHPWLGSGAKLCPFSSAPLPLDLLLLCQDVLPPLIHSPCLSVAHLGSPARDALPKWALTAVKRSPDASKALCAHLWDRT